MNTDEKILKILEQHGKVLEALQAGQEQQGKQLDTQGKDIATIKEVQSEQGKDIKILKTGVITLQQEQSHTNTMIEAIHAEHQDKATKADIEQIEDFIGVRVLDRLDKHNERIEELEHQASIFHKN